MFERIWIFEIQVLPVAFALLLFELPGLIRRMKRLYYVPIYFTFFPLRELNSDLSVYLGEDFFMGAGNLTDKQAEDLRRRIILKSMISMAIAVILTPLVTGFVGAFFLTADTLLQFIVVLVAFKLVGISRAILNFHRHAVGTTRNKIFLGVIYFFYLGVIVQMLTSAYEWTSPYVESRSWGALLSELGGLVFGKVVVQGLVVALLTAFFVSLVADRRLREQNKENEI